MITKKQTWCIRPEAGRCTGSVLVEYADQFFVIVHSVKFTFMKLLYQL